MTDYVPQIKAAYPDINWYRFEDIDKALNFELWHGTAYEYFGGDSPAEELEHYKWESFEKAESDIREILDPLPGEIWLDLDGDGFSSSDPEDYDGYWSYHCATCDDWHFGDDVPEGHEFRNDTPGEWSGGEWERVDPRKLLMFEETYKQVR